MAKIRRAVITAAGTPQRWLETTIALALKDPVIGPRIIDYINGLLHPAICPR